MHKWSTRSTIFVFWIQLLFAYFSNIRNADNFLPNISTVHTFTRCVRFLSAKQRRQSSIRRAHSFGSMTMSRVLCCVVLSGFFCERVEGRRRRGFSKTHTHTHAASGSVHIPNILLNCPSTRDLRKSCCRRCEKTTTLSSNARCQCRPPQPLVAKQCVRHPHRWHIIEMEFAHARPTARVHIPPR